jgi:putative MATE family efflux protein
MSVPTQQPPPIQGARPESLSSELGGFWKTVRASVRGTEEDFTQGSLSRAIILLAVPMMLELVMESAFGLVDVFFVGGLGADAVATVGLTASLVVLEFAIAMGLCMGTTAMVARRIGESDGHGASVAAGQAILAGIGISIPLSIAGVILAPHMLGWMGAEPGVTAGWSYVAITFGSSITIFLLFLNNAILRGAGDAAIAMRVLWLANLINMVLDPCLIYGIGPFPEWGLNGAAIATTIGRGIGVAFQFWVLLDGSRRILVRREHLRLDPEVMKRLLRISVTGMLQFIVATASWLVTMRIIALFGSAALAGYTIALRVVLFVILPAWGMSNAAATLVGQNLGAGKPDRAERAVWLTGAYNVLFLASVAVVFWWSAETLIGWFTSDPAVLAVGVESLRIMTFGQIFAGFSIVTAQAFNGAGDTDTPTFINLVVYWLWQLPLAYVLAVRMEMGVPGVLTAVVIAGLTWAVTGVTLFRRGRWKQRRV